MKKLSPFVLAGAFVFAGAAAALADPSPSTPQAPPADLVRLQGAIFAPAPTAAGLPSGALPMTFFCQEGSDYCVYAQCLCTDHCIPLHQPVGFLTYCSASTRTYGCSCTNPNP